MNVKRWFGVGVSLFVFSLVGITALFVSAQQADMSDEERANMYFAEFMAAPYTDWPFEAGAPEGFYVGQEPHGMVLRAFVNEVVAEATGSGAQSFPEGSILVKENHMPGDVDVSGSELQTPIEGFEGDLAAITFMVKLPGYNPDVGDWFWAKMQPDGTIDAAGMPGGCVACHTQAADNDYVFNARLGDD